MYKHDADVWHAPGSSDHPMAILIRDQTDRYAVCSNVRFISQSKILTPVLDSHSRFHPLIQGTIRKSSSPIQASLIHGCIEERGWEGTNYPQAASLLRPWELPYCYPVRRVGWT